MQEVAQGDQVQVTVKKMLPRSLIEPIFTGARDSGKEGTARQGVQGKGKV